MEWIFSQEELPATAESFWQHYKEQRIFTLEGPMGAGKTTFVKALCAARGVEDATASPTFSIINEYAFTEDGQQHSIYHLDLYRLKDEEEAIAAGVEDTLYRDHAISFIEWPDIISDLLPTDTVRLQLSVLPDKKRVLRAG
ncbi:tRNA (adenosine(37)-N6)-threonylcarbamoyltransferase complex ATPase subunit type 1 TsaE [Chitinophaga rhizophila]|uniref:tRNA threonylcarbamoyladenosine biosynthesis protein TsaE n=1 Tax=Chitinophaga rhizophila TaxID=2866212 RepID=A0ABS7GFZ3_9BACT|nr:tRNA (adenosine(37)-N6)-threonylcarbamoyltransferase complex ATPase subunit type 1 TsaE [Chitinophaga rhizophila]MBW8686607.1 tRNA (adenosine(37)-N6)-threonylcarbamoyltransferase complex ATPase subunit type 1 TsaE [Chitinophaga rhizophila]